MQASPSRASVLRLLFVNPGSGYRCHNRLQEADEHENHEEARRIQADAGLVDGAQHGGQEPEGEAGQDGGFDPGAEARTSCRIQPDRTDSGEKTPNEEDDRTAAARGRRSSQGLHHRLPFRGEKDTVRDEFEYVNDRSGQEPTEEHTGPVDLAHRLLHCTADFLVRISHTGFGTVI
jgi:hypothetical protein